MWLHECIYTHIQYVLHRDIVQIFDVKLIYVLRTVSMIAGI